MAKIRGTIFLVSSLALIIYEIYFLIVEPLIDKDAELSLTSNQYWAIVVPIILLVMLLAGSVGWVGYTMIITPEPIRLDYEEAYEIAAAGVDRESTKEAE